MSEEKKFPLSESEKLILIKHCVSTYDDAYDQMERIRDILNQ